MVGRQGGRRVKTWLVVMMGLSFIGGIMMLLVLGVRRLASLLKMSVKKEAFVVLWLMVILRFCLPIGLEPSFTESWQGPAHQLYQVFLAQEEKNDAKIREEKTYEALLLMTDEHNTEANGKAENNLSTSLSSETKNHQITDDDMIVKVQRSWDFYNIVGLIWLLGIVVALSRFLGDYFRVLNRVQKLDELLYEPLADLQKMMGLKRKIVLKQSDGSLDTAVYGIFKPQIVLSSLDEMTDYILLHELAHLKRQDNLKRFLAQIACCLHWYQPLLWLCRRYLCLDIEMACDEKVLSVLVQDERKSYAQVLYQFASQNRTQFRNSFAAFGENPVKSRVKNILAFKRYGKFWSIVAAVVLVFVLSGCLSAPAEQPTAVKLQAEFVELSDLPLTEDENIVDYTVDGANFYYISRADDGENSRYCLKLYHMNNQNVVTIWRAAEQIDLSGLHYADHMLYFISRENEQNDHAVLMAYDLQKNKAKVLFEPYQEERVAEKWSVKNNTPLIYGDLILNGDDCYLCWHESYYNQSKVLHDELVIWDIKRQAVIAELPANGQQLYGDIIDGVVAYQKTNAKSGETFLVSYNIEDSSETIVANALEGEPFSVYSNGNYVVYKEDFINNAQIIIRELSTGRDYWLWSNIIQNIDGDDLKTAVEECRTDNKWGIKMLGDYLILAGDSQWVMAVDLRNFSIYALENNEYGGAGFYYPKTAGKQMMALNKNGTQLCLYWAQLQ